MSDSINNASSLAAFAFSLNDDHYGSVEDRKMRATIYVPVIGAKGGAEVHITRTSGITGDAVCCILEKAEALGAIKSGVKGTGEVYATF